MTMIIIRIGEESFNANLKRSKSPKTVQAIIDALPIQGNTNTWSDEIYFTVPVDVELENAVGQSAISIRVVFHLPVNKQNQKATGAYTESIGIGPELMQSQNG